MTNKATMQEQLQTSYLSGGNANYIEELYETYLQDPNAIEQEWRDYFASLPAVKDGNSQDVGHSPIREYFQQLAKQHGTTQVVATDDSEQLRKQFRVSRLIDAYRSHGHHQAQLDPLQLAQRLDIPDLHIEFHNLSDTDLDTEFSTNSFAGLDKASLRHLLEVLKKTYCGSIGVEYMHITNTDEVKWMQEKLESSHGQANFSKDQKHRILKKLTSADGLERYLGTRYVGQKRFSLEGGDSLIPMINELVHRSAGHQIKEIAIGMAHRGRLNVLINVFGKSPLDLFAEFEGKKIDELHTGDVKYHLGFSSDAKTAHGVVHMALAFNPSHLEIINPVVEGSVRARQDRREDYEHKQVLPVLIHGDAAFAGQGVVMETFSLSQARGFRTGGSVHIIINNQIGFTTSNPLDARSTLYCSDVAKMVQAPIFHVNGDDPEAVVYVTQLAIDYRTKFKKDVVIDLVCYRRHGHNEADEPAATQPMMYHVIRKHPTPRKIYADKLLAEGSISTDDVEYMMDHFRDKMDQGQQIVAEITQVKNMYAVDWTPYQDSIWDMAADTTIDKARLQELGENMTDVPEGFTLQKQVEKLMHDRKRMVNGERPVDWGCAETLAYASLLADAYPIRLVGQDSGRGTFAHRHVVLHDFKVGQEYTPLKHVADEQERFTVIDSLLSEEAVMAFEYGYSSAEPDSLVIWEGQFGDFANGAQVVIDQFISSGEQKWGRLCGLVLFLPHGYEGQGPEHSSARLERYLQLCAQNNMQVCVPSTPAQAYHMLRRQMIRPYRKPLIVMTPKSLLRHKLAVSSLDDLVQGKFHLVIPEIDDINAEKVEHVVMCSGKVYYELLATRREMGCNNVAIIRIEQLYPFPLKALKAELNKYSHVKKLIWCQEEPRNQGAWFCSRHYLEHCTLPEQQLYYAGRPFSAAPAAGSAKIFQQKQKQLVIDALSGQGTTDD